MHWYIFAKSETNRAHFINEANQPLQHVLHNERLLKLKQFVSFEPTFYIFDAMMPSQRRDAIWK